MKFGHCAFGLPLESARTVGPEGGFVNAIEGARWDTLAYSGSVTCTKDNERYMPAAPALAVLPSGAAWCEFGGRPILSDHSEIRKRLRGSGPVILCHGPATARRLGLDFFPCLDVLELFAFVRPAQFCVPTIGGLASATGQRSSNDLVSQVQSLPVILRSLLAELAQPAYPDANFAGAIARRMAAESWLWGDSVLSALGNRTQSGDYNVWVHLSEWAEHTSKQSPTTKAVTPSETSARLAALVGVESEPRLEQATYASAVVTAFAPRDEVDATRVVIAEAGTGVGKTAGYIAPASVWVDKNEGVVWLSTYTKNLQSQIDRELDRLYPDPETKHKKVVIRKGRENYLCLLNYEDAVSSRFPGPSVDSGALGLIARWIKATRDGDMVGGDLPAWLSGLLRETRVPGLSDHRGECIYSSCSHYRKCFVERAARNARKAELVISNHALVMALGARGEDSSLLPTRYVFDEGHHLFDAADGTFTSCLSGRETFELRRWLRGIEEGRPRRNRGLKSRMEDLVLENKDMEAALDVILDEARVLPTSGWQRRVSDRRPKGVAEEFLCFVHTQVLAKARPNNGYDLETLPRPCVKELLLVASDFKAALSRLSDAIGVLERCANRFLNDTDRSLEPGQRSRLEAVSQSLRRRRLDLIQPWQSMLESLSFEEPEALIDRFVIERSRGRETDVGMYRNWIDPLIPFAEFVVQPADGALITSATLRDGTGDVEKDWSAAEKRVGTHHLLGSSAVRAVVPSPFDYRAATRVMVVNDVDRNDVNQIARAMLKLFTAAGGGALGLFTAIWRLREVAAWMVAPLEEAGLNLLAQHVDGLDVSTLVEIFRSERDSCLLGTDALRDGIDVPGASLRMVVFDRVPWPRSDILHRVRRRNFGGSSYDDMLVRMKLKQAYGRLIRRGDDFGVFVILDAATPSRLLGAFPEDVTVSRVGLEEAVAESRTFIGSKMLV